MNLGSPCRAAVDVNLAKIRRYVDNRSYPNTPGFLRHIRMPLRNVARFPCRSERGGFAWL